MRPLSLPKETALNSSARGTNRYNNGETSAWHNTKYTGPQNTDSNQYQGPWLGGLGDLGHESSLPYALYLCLSNFSLG